MFEESKLRSWVRFLENRMVQLVCTLDKAKGSLIHREQLRVSATFFVSYFTWKKIHSKFTCFSWIDWLNWRKPKTLLCSAQNTKCQQGCHRNFVCCSSIKYWFLNISNQTAREINMAINWRSIGFSHIM